MATVKNRELEHSRQEFYPEAKQGVSHGQRSSTLLSQHFRYTSCVSYISRGEISKPSTRLSLGTTTLSVRADASGVDDYSAYTGDLKRQHLVTTTWGAKQLNRLNETVIIAVFHHHSKTLHNVPVRLASAPQPAFMATDQTSEGPRPLSWKPQSGVSWTDKSRNQYLPIGGGGTLAAGRGLVDGAPGPP